MLKECHCSIPGLPNNKKKHPTGLGACACTRLYFFRRKIFKSLLPLMHLARMTKCQFAQCFKTRGCWANCGFPSPCFTKRGWWVNCGFPAGSCRPVWQCCCWTGTLQAGAEQLEVWTPRSSKMHRLGFPKLCKMTPQHIRSEACRLHAAFSLRYGRTSRDLRSGSFQLWPHTQLYTEPALGGNTPRVTAHNTVWIPTKRYVTHAALPKH